MKKYFTRFMAIACCLAASLTASAQYSKVFEQYPRANYNTDAVNWKLSEIAAALDTDAATLAEAVENVSSSLFYLDGAEDKAYNCTPNGYWMDKDANKKDWGDDAFWYVNIGANADDDTFTLEVGQYPGHFTGGEETAVAHFVLTLNEKNVTFDISLKVKELVIPETPNVLSKLNIIDKKSIEVKQWARSNEKADNDTVDFKGIAAALGTTPDVFSAGIASIVFATKKDQSEENIDLGIKGDTLTNVSTANTPGWWFTNTNDGNGYDTFVAGSDGYFFAENFALNPETEELTFDIGQRGGALPIDASDLGLGMIDHLSTPVYFVWDGKAVELTIKLVIEERDKVPFNEMEEVGSEEIILEQYPTTDYSTKSFTLNLDSIAGLLGVGVAELTLWAPLSADEITDESSAGNQGFWFNKDGYRESWGANCGIFVENPTSGDYSRFNVGQYPSVFEGGDTGIATIYFVAGVKYYTVHVTMNILTKEGPVAEFQSVATRAVNIQIIPAGSYDVEMTYTIDANDFELIGTTDPTLYGRKNPGDGSEWTDGYTDTYTCTPYPGFWMSKEGYPRGWNTSADDYSPWGMTFADDLFTFYQIPNHNKVGDEYKAVLYLVNDVTGKMITYNFTVKFVSEVVPQAEVVGQEALTLPVKNDDETATALDVTAALEKIGFTSASQLFAVPSLCALTVDGAMSEPVLPGGGIWLNSEGAIYNGDDAPLGLEFTDNGDTEVVVNVYEMTGQWTADSKITSKFGFQNDAKIYVYNVTFEDEAVVNGITSAKAAKSAKTIFDLSGRRVERTQRGIYIRDGKKMVVK